MRIDIYSEECVLLWVRLNSGLEIERVGTHTIGVEPEWFEYEIHQDGLDALIPNERGSYDEPEWFRYAMNYGLAPRQPFLVRILKPYYYSYTTMDGTEHDVDYEAEFIRAAPLDPLEAAKRWRSYWDALAVWKAESNAREEKLRRMQHEDVASMKLRFFVYFASGDPYWDDMSMPSGIGYALVTSRTSLTKRTRFWGEQTLAQGRSDKGDHDEARRDLYANAVRRGITLTEEALKNLHVFGP